MYYDFKGWQKDETIFAGVRKYRLLGIEPKDEKQEETDFDTF